MSDTYPTSQDKGTYKLEIHESRTGITDDVLLTAGLKKVTAFVRIPASDGAQRSKKARERTAKGGAHQVNVVMPTEHHENIKKLAKLLREGASIEDSIGKVFPMNQGKNHGGQGLMEAKNISLSAHSARSCDGPSLPSLKVDFDKKTANQPHGQRDNQTIQAKFRLLFAHFSNNIELFKGKIRIMFARLDLFS
ncbi:hypothetical protein [Roseateles albus]|uniref:Uncharacterized protein n=1 Tax=Roseateles albus TaxID=2987525 RepID=A0ABT5KBI3_9BURK|nr:hypothetical protein [Roseateles albus]MDC8770929.1 hypothetical protein [Roseateles albus]